MAQRSTSAAREIKALIEKSSTDVASGVGLVSRTGEALRVIGQHVVDINDFMVQLAASAKDQAKSLTEVNVAMRQMDSVTQQNAAMVEETTAASSLLTQETGRLDDQIGQFRLFTKKTGHGVETTGRGTKSERQQRYA